MLFVWVNLISSFGRRGVVSLLYLEGRLQAKLAMDATYDFKAFKGTHLHLTTSETSQKFSGTNECCYWYFMQWICGNSPRK